MVKDLAVYAGWVGLAAPLRLGWLRARRGARRDVFEFEFEASALAHTATLNLHLDPRLGLFEGRQHPPQGHGTFGVFADASRIAGAGSSCAAAWSAHNGQGRLTPGKGWRLSEPTT